MSRNNLLLPIFGFTAKTMLAAVIIMGGHSALARINILSVTGMSEFDNGPDLREPIIYGGTGGQLYLCDTGSHQNETCNNCSSEIAACNTRRIYDDLILELKFKIPSLLNGERGHVRAFVRGAPRLELDLEPSSSNNVGKNDIAVLRVKWAKVCQTIGNSGETTCEGSSLAEILTIGIDANGDGMLSSSESGIVHIKVDSPNLDGISADSIEICSDAAATDGGICEWKMTPGNERVSLEGLQAADDFPRSGGLEFVKLRVFASDVGFLQANPNPNNPIPWKDFAIIVNSEDSEYDLESNYFDGLENFKTYFFRVGVVDAANNLAYITSNEAILTLCSDSRPLSILGPVGHLLYEDNNCPFMAVPVPSHTEMPPIEWNLSKAIE